MQGYQKGVKENLFNHQCKDQTTQTDFEVDSVSNQDMIKDVKIVKNLEADLE